MTSVLFLSPPFYSHARPLAVLAEQVAKIGAKVGFACVPELRHLIDTGKVTFVPFEATANRNLGRGTTDQPASGRERLDAFLEATRQSAIDALIVQAHNRLSDMFFDPDATCARLKNLLQAIQPDWCVIDQLNYPVTLALMLLRVPFASACIGHPSDIPLAGSYFGVPDNWPPGIVVERQKLAILEKLALDVDRTMTAAFNTALAERFGEGEEIASASHVSSSIARLFSYPPEFASYPAIAGRDFFMGYCAATQAAMPDHWRRILAAKTSQVMVLITFGTFLWVHTDTLRIVVAGVRTAYPDALIIVTAGDGAETMSDLADDNTMVVDFVPQFDVLRHMDIAIHHGGNNTFTETLVRGVPSLVLPFSSDQFAVAHDVVRHGIGRVLDPHRLTREDVSKAVTAVNGRVVRTRLKTVSKRVRARGPGWMAAELIGVMDGYVAADRARGVVIAVDETVR